MTPHVLRHAAATALVYVGLPLTDVGNYLATARRPRLEVRVRPNDRMADAARQAARRFDAA